MGTYFQHYALFAIPDYEVVIIMQGMKSSTPLCFIYYNRVWIRKIPRFQSSLNKVIQSSISGPNPQPPHAQQ